MECPMCKCHMREGRCLSCGCSLEERKTDGMEKPAVIGGVPIPELKKLLGLPEQSSNQKVSQTNA